MRRPIRPNSSELHRPRRPACHASDGRPRLGFAAAAGGVRGVGAGAGRRSATEVNLPSLAITSATDALGFLGDVRRVRRRSPGEEPAHSRASLVDLLARLVGPLESRAGARGVPSASSGLYCRASSLQATSSARSSPQFLGGGDQGEVLDPVLFELVVGLVELGVDRALEHPGAALDLGQHDLVAPAAGRRLVGVVGEPAVERVEVLVRAADPVVAVRRGHQPLGLAGTGRRRSAARAM